VRDRLLYQCPAYNCTTSLKSQSLRSKLESLTTATTAKIRSQQSTALVCSGVPLVPVCELSSRPCATLFEANLSE
jgi:hypothetical protein